MTSDDLEPEQARKLMANVARQLRFLNRLSDRMLNLGFVPADPLLKATLHARDAMQSLHVAAHYASCKSGVGRSARP